MSVSTDQQNPNPRLPTLSPFNLKRARRESKGGRRARKERGKRETRSRQHFPARIPGQAPGRGRGGLGRIGPGVVTALWEVARGWLVKGLGVRLRQGTATGRLAMIVFATPPAGLESIVQRACPVKHITRAKANETLKDGWMDLQYTSQRKR